MLKTFGSRALIEALGASDDVISGALNDGVLQVNDFATLEVAGPSFTNNGTVVLAGSTAASLQIDNNLTLLGGGNVLMSNTAGEATIRASNVSTATLIDPRVISAAWARSAAMASSW